MKFIIPNLIFVFLLAVATGYLTFLTTKGGLTDNRFTKLWDKLTKRGRKVFYSLLFIAILLVGQEWNNQNKTKNNDEAIKEEQRKRDSIIENKVNKGVSSNSRKLFADISEAFAKQGLELDTVKKVVKKIQDSVNATLVLPSNDPILHEQRRLMFKIDDNNNLKILFKVNVRDLSKKLVEMFPLKDSEGVFDEQSINEKFPFYNELEAFISGSEITLSFYDPRKNKLMLTLSNKVSLKLIPSSDPTSGRGDDFLTMDPEIIHQAGEIVARREVNFISFECDKLPMKIQSKESEYLSIIDYDDVFASIQILNRSYARNKSVIFDWESVDVSMSVNFSGKKETKQSFKRFLFPNDYPTLISIDSLNIRF